MLVRCSLHTFVKWERTYGVAIQPILGKMRRKRRNEKEKKTEKNSAVKNILRDKYAYYNIKKPCTCILHVYSVDVVHMLIQ